MLDVALPCAHTAPNHIALSGPRGAKNMPARIRSRSMLLTVCMPVLLGVAPSCTNGNFAPDVVPGTTHIQPGSYSPWFTISPDEQWIAFLEVDSTEWGGEMSYKGPGHCHLVTMSLTNRRTTRHKLGPVVRGLLAEKNLPPWMQVQDALALRSWSGGTLFLMVRTIGPNQHWIAFTPGLLEATESEPSGEMSCCACPPRRDYPTILRDRGLGGRFGYGLGVAAYRNGSFSDTIYASPVDSDVGVVDRIDPDGSIERVFQHEGMLREGTVTDLAISPNGKYLAIVVTTNIRSPIPLPTLRSELHILNLVTGAGAQAGGIYRLIGNLMWSEDSQRLYYAAVNGETGDGKGDGVFLIRLPH